MSQSRSVAAAPTDVVGWYGDPLSTWGIGIDVRLGCEVPSEAEIVARFAQCQRAHPHLIGLKVLRCRPEQVWQDFLAGVIGAPYPQQFRATGTRARQAAVDRNSEVPYDVRIGIGKPGQIVVAAHHGTCDGLGLLALLGAVLEVPLYTAAAGIADQPASTGFYRRAWSRLIEAVFSPPPRMKRLDVQANSRATPIAQDAAVGTAEIFEEVDLPGLKVSTARLAAATATLVQQTSGRPPVFAIGASRRDPSAPLTPDRQTAFLRLRVPSSASLGEVHGLLKTTEPEPVFPETTSAGIGPAITRLLRNRLGSSATLSNLGRVVESGVSTPAGAVEMVQKVAMYAALSGPRAVVVGLVSTHSHTTLSVRVRSSDYSAREAREMLHHIAEGMAQYGS